MSASPHPGRRYGTQLFLPALGYDEGDLSGTLELLPLLGAEEGELGLMLVSRDGIAGFQGERAAVQCSNLERAAKAFGRLNLLVMAPNRVEEFDFYHRPEDSLANLKSVVDLASRLPQTGDPPFVSFHLNTLFTAQEWSEAGQGPDQKLEFFSGIFREQVLPILDIAAEYAGARDIALKVETTPVPEFGDLADPDLNTLGNPFPLYSQRGFRELRERGFNVVMDLCHGHTQFAAASSIKEGRTGYDDYKGLFPADLDYLASATLLSEVISLKPGDIVHLNDSRGLFDSVKGELHEEGVALGEGDIRELPDIIRTVLAKGLPIVFEINETDYLRRPNLRRSIEYFLKHANDHDH